MGASLGGTASMPVVDAAPGQGAGANLSGGECSTTGARGQVPQNRALGGAWPRQWAGRRTPECPSRKSAGPNAGSFPGSQTGRRIRQGRLGPASHPRSGSKGRSAGTRREAEPAAAAAHRCQAGEGPLTVRDPSKSLGHEYEYLRRDSRLLVSSRSEGLSRRDTLSGTAPEREVKASLIARARSTVVESASVRSARP